jgi:hypothetical protein
MQTPSLSLLLAFLSAPLLALTAAAQGQVWVVDWLSGPGSHFNALQPAIDSASNGDTILVRDGTYGPFVINAKALTIAASSQSRPSIGYAGNATRVDGIPGGLQVCLRGLEIYELEANNCSGLVWIEDCLLNGAPALGANNCSDLVVAHSSATGRSGFYCPSYPGPYCFFPASVGASLQNTTVTWLSSSAVGGRGANETALDSQIPSAQGSPTDGASGLIMQGGELRALRGVFTGGAGGSASGSGGGWVILLCHPGGNGATGLELHDAAAHLRASTLSGGAAGTGEMCIPLFPFDPPAPTPDGTPGLPVALIGSANLLESALSAPDASGNSPVREGQHLNLLLAGEPSQVVLLALADPAPSLDLGTLGWLHFDTLLLLDAAQLNVAGVASRSYPLTQLPGALQGYMLLVQTGQVVGGNLELGTALQTLLLDAAY